MRLIKSNVKKIKAHWLGLYECVCGKKHFSRQMKDGSSRSKSCGCLLNGKQRTHGMTNNAEHKTWLSIRQRCYSKNCPAYHRYGGRGILMSDEWYSDFKNFYRDMAPKPNGGWIERIDNDKGYSKENCKWSTPLEQQNNKSNNVNYQYQGRSQPLSMWAREMNIEYSTIYRRVGKLNWPVSRALEAPSRVIGRLYLYRNERKTLYEWSDLLSLNPTTIKARLVKGMTFKNAVEKPIGKYKRKTK